LLFRSEEGFLPLLQKLVAERLPVTFHLPNGLHARYVTPTLARLMYAAGFRTIRLSLETASPSWQEQTGGKVSQEEFERAVRYFREAGFSSHELEVYLLFGWPGSTSEDLKMSVDSVRSMGLVPRLALYAPTPETLFYRELPSFFQEEPLWHNKIAYLYATGNEHLYEELQRRGGETVCR
ncbi:MAG: radical SAM protein, partial [Candidatus Caldatribacteriaceae bacterium]